MKPAILVICAMTLVIFCPCCKGEDKREHVFSPEIIGNEELFRPALGKRFTNLETQFYHFDGHMVFALFREKGTNKHLFILLPDPIGNVVVTINGKKINPLKNPAKLKLATGSHRDDGGNGYDFSKPEDKVIGGWLTLEPEDKFTVNAEVIYPRERELFAEYSPPNKVETWVKQLKAQRVIQLKKEMMEE